MDELLFTGICGSLRKASRNMGLLRAARELAPQGCKVEIATISDIPFYNADIEKPDSVKRLVELAERSNGYVLACPEYNYSLAPALKNALDWLSREPNLKPFSGKTAAIMGAGGGMGTVRSQAHLRQVCVYLNLFPLNKPELFANAFSDEFDANGNVVAKSLQDKVANMMQALYSWTKTLNGAQ